MDLNATSRGTFYINKKYDDWIGILNELLCLGFTVQMTANSFEQMEHKSKIGFPPKRVCEMKFNYFMGDKESEEK